MAAPNLKLVEEPDPGTCGVPTESGSPCSRRVEDGPCWQHRDDDEPATGSPSLPPPPGHLGEYGRECWDYQVADCDRLGILEQIDLTLIEQTAEIYQMKRLAFEAAQRGPTIKGRGGSEKKNPAVGKHKDYSTEYRQCIKELARLKAAATPEPEPEGMGRWL